MFYPKKEAVATAQNSQNEGMTQLIPITEQDGKKAVSARMLHAFLESKQQFGNWIQNRIDQYGFVENQDFEVFNNFIKNPSGGRPLTEYALSLDMAKELSMVEGNAKGKIARQYFIEQDKKAQQLQKPLSPAEMFLQQAQMMVEQERRMTVVENKVFELEAKTTTRPDEMTIAGYGTLHGIHVNLQIGSKLGKAAKKLSDEKGITLGSIPDPRFGKVYTYPKYVLEQVFNELKIA